MEAYIARFRGVRGDDGRPAVVRNGHGKPRQVLVVMGVRLDGMKEIIAIDDGYRESKESWLTLLRDLRDRGMQAPVLAVGDGALGFWGALSEVFPATRDQRCWFHYADLRIMPMHHRESASTAVIAVAPSA